MPLFSFDGRRCVHPGTASQVFHHLMGTLDFTVPEGVSSPRLHDLRHSFASSLVNKNTSIYTVQRLLGHANIRSTQRYSHLNDETLSEAVEVIGRLFDAAEGRG